MIPDTRTPFIARQQKARQPTYTMDARYDYTSWPEGMQVGPDRSPAGAAWIVAAVAGAVTVVLVGILYAPDIWRAMMWLAGVL